MGDDGGGHVAEGGQAMKLWIVGQNIGGDESPAWDCAGVFSSVQLAVAACRDETYWIGPATLDATLPHEVVDWPGVVYPFLQGIEGLS